MVILAIIWKVSNLQELFHNEWTSLNCRYEYQAVLQVQQSAKRRGFFDKHYPGKNRQKIIAIWEEPFYPNPCRIANPHHPIGLTAVPTRWKSRSVL